MSVTYGGMKEELPEKAQNRVAEIFVQKRHGAGLNAAVEAIAYNEVGSVSQFNNKPWNVC
jgi:hypothetical protein